MLLLPACTAQGCTAQPAQHSFSERAHSNAAQHSAAHSSAAQHSTPCAAQHSAAQHSTAHLLAVHLPLILRHVQQLGLQGAREGDDGVAAVVLHVWWARDRKWACAQGGVKGQLRLQGA